MGRVLRLKVKMVRMVYGTAVSLLAVRAGLDPCRVLAAPTEGGKSIASTVRQRAIYLVVVGLDVNYSAAAQAAGVSKQAVHKALRRVEDDRDDTVLDQVLDQLTDFVQANGVRL